MKVTNNPTAGVDASTAALHSRRAEKSSGAESKETKSAKRTEIEGDSRPEISGKARERATAKKVASETPDVREAKIAELKERIAAGHYKVDPKAVADRMVDEHLSSGIG
jgi:negative regulator of flagellin synthesis FlgM